MYDFKPVHITDNYAKNQYVLRSEFKNITVVSGAPVYFTCDMPGGTGSVKWTLNGVTLNNSIDSTGSLLIKDTKQTFGSTAAGSCLSCSNDALHSSLTAMILFETYSANLSEYIDYTKGYKVLQYNIARFLK